ncbi:HAD-IIB family hydrolase [Sulfurovum mangrovi]|uniref:HAD-IIB family hydrolase n=1 Tax=Sulfurovum mangrovi TaxID=2893889 RepID=UPI001E29218A|nr:HAD-IIB family hydrolase [Sulfurovum mangrovi]UFH58456.1 HAD-IIB family hydrolase [Sulfurovum mangrovi]
MLKEKTIIFTDLDGTLLDHDSYSFEDAVPMLDLIKRDKIPLIIVTSKTKEEVLRIQKLLDLREPFIVENGAGIFIPSKAGYKRIAMGFEYAYIRSCFVKYARSVPILGFSDMSDEEVANYTGLSIENASDAKKRDFTEPFILEDKSSLDALREMAYADKLDIVEGGRFYHLITRGQDKANAIRFLIDHYEKSSDAHFKTIALGDSANDLSMLQSADTPVLIPHSDGTFMACAIDGLIRAPFPGPKGWNSVLKEYFDAK